MPGTKHKYKKKQVRTKQSRKSVSKVIQRKRNIPAKRLQRFGKTTGINTTGIVTATVVGRQFEPKSVFAIEPDFSRNLIEHLDALYKCLKKAGFKDDRNWPTQPSTSELADYLFGEVKKVIPEGFEWLFYNDCIYYYKPFPKLDEYYGMPMEWLPEIQLSNDYLHQLIIGTIYYVSKKCNIDLFQTQFEQHVIEHSQEDPDVFDNPFLKLDLQRHYISQFNDQHGICVQYQEMMKEFYGTFSQSELIDMLLKFEPKNQLEKEIIEWLHIGITVLKNPAQLHNYCFRYFDVYDGDQLTIDNAIHFIWSFHDALFEEAEEYRNAQYNEFGNAEPTIFGVFSPIKHTKPADIKPLEYLTDFMKAGRAFYFKNYEQRIAKFYDIRRHNQAI